MFPSEDHLEGHKKQSRWTGLKCIWDHWELPFIRKAYLSLKCESRCVRWCFGCNHGQKRRFTGSRWSHDGQELSATYISWKAVQYIFSGLFVNEWKVFPWEENFLRGFEKRLRFVHLEWSNSEKRKKIYIFNFVVSMKKRLKRSSLFHEPKIIRYKSLDFEQK